MKVAFLYQEGNNLRNEKQKIIGIYVWDNGEWNLHITSKLKNQILRKTEQVSIGVCKETKKGIYRNSKTFSSYDFDFIKVVNEVLMWEFRPSLSVGDIESLDKSSIARFTELLEFIE